MICFWVSKQSCVYSWRLRGDLHVFQPGDASTGWQCAVTPARLHLLPVRPGSSRLRGRKGVLFPCWGSAFGDRCLTLSLSSQARPLVRVRLLRCHVHQRRQRSQAGRGEDGGSRPRCVVGPGAVRVHGYGEMLTCVCRYMGFYSCRFPTSKVCVYLFRQYAHVFLFQAAWS